MIQLISGIFISFHYRSIMEFSFFRIVHISREVNLGWLVRLIHINGASLFFFIMYIHITKNLINSSWKFILVWLSGILILLISIITAFIGYVLPWGQISFWAATVITNLLSIIPLFGQDLVEWLWGGFSVSYPTLMRFFSFHFILPLLVLIIVLIHIIFLHIYGSSNSINSLLDLDKIRFDPFFLVKDLIGILLLIFFFIIILCFNPYYSIDSENFIEANPIITPIHIKPEWYFLFAYSILRAVPRKIGGVIGLFLRIIILLIKPFQVNQKIKFNFLKKIFLFNYFFTFLILRYLGSKPIEFPFEILSKLFIFNYFFFSLVI